MVDLIMNMMRSEKGKYIKFYQDDDFITVLKNMGGEASSSEIAEQMDCSTKTVIRRMSNIKNVKMKRIGKVILFKLK